MKHNLFYFLFLTLFISGCASSVDKVNNTVQLDKFPKHQIPKEIEPPKAQAKGSLFSNHSNSLFSDRKALQVGDIVNVKVYEGTEGDDLEVKTGGTLNQGQSRNTRSLNPVSVSGSEDTPGIMTSIINGLNGILGIGITGGEGTSRFTTDSGTTADDLLENNIATIVTQEFQNGNYFIEGEKDIIIKGQKITLKLSGVMNPQDLSTNSEIDSKRLANLKVMLYKEGTEADLDEKPWGTKIIDTITPF